MFPIGHIKEKEGRIKMWIYAKRQPLCEKTNDGLWKEQTLGTTGSGRCS